MYDLLREILPYISGLYTLPWILVGFFITILISTLSSRERIDAIMKKIGLILLFFFVPLLLFRIFLNTSFGTEQIGFSFLVCMILFFMYLLAFAYAYQKNRKAALSQSARTNILKTILTNQGRSSAFIGGAMLAIPEWSVAAGLYMALVGIALFAIIPYFLAQSYKKEITLEQTTKKPQALPWFLRIYPWYLISFIVAAISLHSFTGITTSTLGDAGLLLQFFTALTIPAALYYVGAGIHPSDLKKTELKKLISSTKNIQQDNHWKLVRNIVFLTVIITPLCTLLVFTPLIILQIIPKEWFAVIIINAFLPITSTNMFLVPYGIDKKVTAHVVTWTTLICVPIVVLLIYLFSVYL